MNIQENAEVKTQPIRATEGSAIESESDLYGKGDTRTASGQSTDFGIGVSRATGAPTASDFITPSIAGKILDQLISQAESEVNNARACIKWYEDEEVKAVAKLTELRQLREAIQGNESTEMAE